jgi:DNA ligase (NAD+)
VGETTARKLALHFGSIDQLRNATYEQLLEVEEVGDRIAQSIVEYFAKPYHLELIEKLGGRLQLSIDERQTRTVE